MSKISNRLQISYLQTSELKNPKHNIRKFSKKQTEKTKQLVETCGLPIPIIVDRDKVVIVGLSFLVAAREMKIDEVPVVIAEHLSEEQARILQVAYYRLADEGEFDKAELSLEFQDLLNINPDCDLTITGFEMGEIDVIIDFKASLADIDEEILEPDDSPPTTKMGDIFQLGDHRIICGDSLLEKSFQEVMGDDIAQMCFTDHPYNLRINGHVSGLGKHKHDEFAQGSGEMSSAKFEDFLFGSLGLMSKFSNSGAIFFCCMDWRHTSEIQSAAQRAKLITKNICVWVKDNGGMGSLYRSRHEFVYVFKHGDSPHINNVQLGKHGRNRTNVWETPGCNTMRKGRLDDLAMHPTVKPVPLVAEAIKDCSNRGGIILDPFGGSGTTLIACEKTGRKARLVEIDPKYVDVTIKRWQSLTGQKAILASTGQYFDDLTPDTTQLSAK